MKYSVNSNPNQLVPLELGPALIDAMSAWVKGHQASGKPEAACGYAGTGGGGGILSVGSHEELDAVMSGFPFGPFSGVEIIPIVDLEKALNNTKKAMQAMPG